MSFNSLILIWFDKNKRNLPWRDQSEPYKIWLSEIILQQTRVAQGWDYYVKFLENFPDIQTLANASEQEVLRNWQGLGYYTRARNLHHTANYIWNDLNGVFPSNYSELLKLKGVGPYSAAAISSIAFHEPIPAIDGNVFRVFARYFNIDLDISLPKTRNHFFELGKSIIDIERPGDFNQAVMELGATVCLPQNPKCEICPLQNSCAALAANKMKELPIKTKKTKVSHRYLHFLEIRHENKLLLVKRIEKDVWLNLFSFPLIEIKIEEEIEDQFAKLELEFKNTRNEIHLLSHQKLHLHFWQTTVSKNQFIELSEKLNAQIYSQDQLDLLPFPRPMEKYLLDKN